MFERRSTGRVCVRDCAEGYMPALETIWRGVDFLVNFTAEHSSSPKLLTVLAMATELHIPSSEFVEVHCTDEAHWNYENKQLTPGVCDSGFLLVIFPLFQRTHF